MTTQTRQPKGVPVGGRFAAITRTEANNVHLAEPPEQVTVEDELEELADIAQAEYDEAVEVYDDCAHDAELAATHGSDTERKVMNGWADEAHAALKSVDRHRLAIRLAADPSTGRPDFADFANPGNLTGVRKAVKDAKAGKVPGILLRHEATQKLDGRLDIAGPADGTPLYVDMQSGFTPLRVTSGTVVINARSNMGTGIWVGRDATVVVVAAPDRKVSTTVDGGVALLVASAGSRGYQSCREGVLDVVGPTADMSIRKNPAA